ncbi:MAG: hypothetical protein R2864_06375 [Syntrophotaleaceae bacterium]
MLPGRRRTLALIIIEGDQAVVPLTRHLALPFDPIPHYKRRTPQFLGAPDLQFLAENISAVLDLASGPG